MTNYGIMICTGLSAAALRRKAGYEKRRRPAMRMMAIANTLDDLAALVKARWNVNYHPSSLSRVVRRLGFSRQKARPSHPKKNAAAQEAFKKGAGPSQRHCRYT